MILESKRFENIFFQREKTIIKIVNKLTWLACATTYSIDEVDSIYQ